MCFTALSPVDANNNTSIDKSTQVDSNQLKLIRWLKITPMISFKFEASRIWHLYSSWLSRRTYYMPSSHQFPQHQKSWQGWRMITIFSSTHYILRLHYIQAYNYARYILRPTERGVVKLLLSTRVAKEITGKKCHRQRWISVYVRLSFQSM